MSNTILKHMVVMVVHLIRYSGLSLHLLPKHVLHLYSSFIIHHLSSIWVYLQFTFADDENLIGISGTVGVYAGYTVITSLSFLTNKKKYGPYGTTQGTSFSLPVAKGSFGGFSGNYGDYLDSFSVILHPY